MITKVELAPTTVPLSPCPRCRQETTGTETLAWSTATTDHFLITCNGCKQTLSDAQTKDALRKVCAPCQPSSTT